MKKMEKRNYTQEEQTEIVRDAMTLTSTIQVEEEELARLRAEAFRAKPAPPKRKVLPVPQIQAQLPSPPKTQYRFSEYLKDSWKTIVIFCLVGAAVFFFPRLPLALHMGAGRVFSALITSIIGGSLTFSLVILLVMFVRYRKECQRRNEELAQSPEYLQAVEAAKNAAAAQQKKAQDETAAQQAQIDGKYQSDLEQYQKVTLPAYEEELARWQEKQREKIAILEEDLEINQETLAKLYDTTRLVSLTYRNLWILRWLYDDMRSSDHDIRYATELLDRERQRIATEQSGRLVQEAIGEVRSDMMSGFQAVYAAVDSGNEALVEELRKTRRHQDVSSVIGTVQRHQLNRSAKTQTQLLDKHLNRK